MERQAYDTRGLVVLWALAESGIGGILHAFKLPFTGIFVGGIAVLCIGLLAYYDEDKKSILRALSVVLAVKLIASPHSPWQAYVAVAFQGLAGYLIFNQKNGFALRSMIFALLCLIESAAQKIMLAILVFGTDFFAALDKAASGIAQSLGLDGAPSMVSLVFGSYVFLHIITGIFLGYWLPGLPNAIEGASIRATETTEDITLPKGRGKSGMTMLLLLLSAAIIILNFLLPAYLQMNLPLLLIRVVVITALLTFVVGPVLKYLILRKLSDKSANQSEIESILTLLPMYRQYFISQYRYTRQNFSGLERFRQLMLGMLVFSIKNHEEKPT